MNQTILVSLLSGTMLAGCTAPEQGAAPAQESRRALSSVPGLATDTAFAAEVREAFLHAWSGYERYAWGHDDLRPLTLGSHDWYDVPLLMTPVDAYDTMLLMGLDEEAARAKEVILGTLSFDQDITVQVFEVTIRLLGGLLSAYQMDGDARWLELATDLADRLLPAFDSPTGMPYVRVNLATGATREPENNPAEIGTLTLEFGLLSALTGDARYADAVERGVTEVFRRRSALDLVGEVLNVETGEWTDPSSHVSGRIDSYYEYLLKAWLLFGDGDFLTMWETSREALNAHVADEVDGRLWYGQVDMSTGARLSTRFGALDAFLPAVLALGGDLDRAARLQESVWVMWEAFGIEPESFDYTTMDIGYPAYPLRPEAIESAYYLFVLTGDERWRDMGREMFHRVVAAARTDAGFAHLGDVRTGEQTDDMQSFFLAETLKYAYLLADPSALDFDAVVFNTEAHPLRPIG
ncbi:MAG TPA: glycoside hydrolase family 47 protein [Longimicrobiales bacterium]|nr:glycoside hydrolase family 47 protein [Longimicrobiales bacterium]